MTHGYLKIQKLCQLTKYHVVQSPNTTNIFLHSVSFYHNIFLANVSDAWNVLRNWADSKIDYVAQSGSTALICGIAVWVVTGLILLGLMALDCASIQQIRNRCKRNKRVVGAFITA